MSTDRVIHTGTGWSSLQRPRFSAGLLLEDDDLNVGVQYTRDLMRVVFKSFFGCGVVCGLDVTVTPTCHDTKRRIDVARGVAIDCAGNLIEVPRSWSHEFGPECAGEYPNVIWVVLCYTERCCRKRDAACSDDEGQLQPTRIQSGYEIHLYNDYIPECACRCPTATDPKDPDAPSHGCCHEHRQARTGQDDSKNQASKSINPCDCYKDHYDGVCECESSCKCVVLAKINKPAEIIEKDVAGTKVRTVDITTDMVRRVRPLLRGYVDCFVAPKSPPSIKADDPRAELRRAENALKQAEADVVARKAEFEAAKKAEAEAAKAAEGKKK